MADLMPVEGHLIGCFSDPRDHADTLQQTFATSAMQLEDAPTIANNAALTGLDACMQNACFSFGKQSHVPLDQNNSKRAYLA